MPGHKTRGLRDGRVACFASRLGGVTVAGQKTLGTRVGRVGRFATRVGAVTGPGGKTSAQRRGGVGVRSSWMTNRTRPLTRTPPLS